MNKIFENIDNFGFTEDFKKDYWETNNELIKAIGRDIQHLVEKIEIFEEKDGLSDREKIIYVKAYIDGYIFSDEVQNNQ